MPVFYHNVMYREGAEGKDEAYLKLYDGHDWKWFCCAAETYGYGIFKKTLVGQKSFGANVGEKDTTNISCVLRMRKRYHLNQDTCQRANDLQRGS